MQFLRRKTSPDPSWPFLDPPDQAVFTTRAVLEGDLPILLVVHDDDGDWQFLCGTTNETSEARVIGLQEALKIDGGHASLADLPAGWTAERRSPSEPWVRQPRPADWG